jgi:thioredoxin-like negative regulator of GroEL
MTAEDFKKICDTAEGYIDLGMLDDAAHLLEDVPTNLRITKEVIVLHMTILLKSGQSLKASYLAENLSFGDPDNVGLALEVAHLKFDAGEHSEALREAHMLDPDLKWKSLDDPAFETIYGAEKRTSFDHTAPSIPSS